MCRKRVEIRRPLLRNLRCGSFREINKQFPPPMPLLSQTGNLSWVLRRSSSDNGSLIIQQQVKLRHHKFFHACRANGRLTLELVCPVGLKQKEKEEEKEEEDQEQERETKIKVDSGVPNRTPLLPLSSSPGLDFTDVGRWPAQEHMKKKSAEDQMRRAVSSPALLSLARPESSFGVGGGGVKSRFGMKRSESLFQMTTPTIHPVDS